MNRNQRESAILALQFRPQPIVKSKPLVWNSHRYGNAQLILVLPMANGAIWQPWQLMC
jgi:hypothetical protein